jgi:hypothetical protein
MLDRKRLCLYVLETVCTSNSNWYLTGIIQVYQDFDEFQLVAANQLISNSNCEGTLPVFQIYKFFCDEVRIYWTSNPKQLNYKSIYSFKIISFSLGRNIVIENQSDFDRDSLGW